MRFRRRREEESCCAGAQKSLAPSCAAYRIRTTGLRVMVGKVSLPEAINPFRPYSECVFGSNLHLKCCQVLLAHIRLSRLSRDQRGIYQEYT